MVDYKKLCDELRANRHSETNLSDLQLCIIAADAIEELQVAMKEKDKRIDDLSVRLDMVLSELNGMRNCQGFYERTSRGI